MPDPSAPERIWRLPRYSSSGYIYVTTRPEHTGALVVTEYVRADKAREQLAAKDAEIARLRSTIEAIDRR